MRLTIITTLLFALAVAKKAPYDDWSNQKLTVWLKDHHVPIPSGDLNKEQLKELVRENYDSAYDKWSDADFKNFWIGKTGEWSDSAQQSKDDMVKGMRRAYAGSWEKWDESEMKGWLQDHGIITPPKTTKQQLKSYMEALNPLASGEQHPQYFFALRPSTPSVQDRLINTWEDSQLRSYLDEKGVQAGKTRDEMVAKVKLEMDKAEKERKSWGHSIEKSWYAATDGVRRSWDFVTQKFDDGKDYVWSTWDESTTREWLDIHAPEALKPAPKDTKKDLVEKMKIAYNEQSNNVYDTWSDSYLRKWLQDHGVVKSKTATTRNELLDLMSRNYYSARDTTYSFWSDSQIRHWLQSRGLLGEDPKTHQELLDMISDKYYELRDPAYAAWDDSMLRSWLVEKNVIDDRSDLEKTRDEYLDLMKDYYYDANEYIWDTWSDAKQRAWLAKEGIVDNVTSAKDAAAYRRDQMEKYLTDSYHSSWDTVYGTWKESDARQWLIDNGYMKSDYEAKRDEIYDMIKKNYKAANKKGNEYYGWSNNRIRGWLRDHGVKVAMPSQREELLQLMKENYVSTQGTLSSLMETIQGWLHSGVEIPKQAIGTVQDILNAAVSSAKYDYTSASVDYEARKTASAASKSAASVKAKITDKAKSEL